MHFLRILQSVKECESEWTLEAVTARNLAADDRVNHTVLLRLPGKKFLSHMPESQNLPEKQEGSAFFEPLCFVLCPYFPMDTSESD